MVRSEFKYVYFFLGLCWFIISCADKPNFSEAPQIEFVSFSKTVLSQGNVLQDTTFLTISFTDGDGDIGSENNTERNIFIIDNRTDTLYTDYKIPVIPQEGANNGIQGTIRMMMFSACCVFPDGIPPCESPAEFPDQQVNFDIYMIDNAGNMSNTITTPSITFICD